MMTACCGCSSRMSARTSIPFLSGRARSSNTTSKERSPIWARPSRPVPATTTVKPSRWSRVSSDSRIAASSSIIRILPALCGRISGGVLRRVIGVTSDTAKSDMDCLPRRYQGKIQGEGGAFAGAALHANMARVFLNDAVGYRKPKTGSAILAVDGRSLSREKWIVDAVNILLFNSRTGVRNANADEVAVRRSYVQHTAARHSVFGIQKQIQKHLLQAAGAALDEREVIVQFAFHLDMSHLKLVFK